LRYDGDPNEWMGDGKHCSDRDTLYIVDIDKVPKQGSAHPAICLSEGKQIG
jgi:hypothetical protein